MSEIGAMAAAQQNWSHSTASTSLAAGGGGSGAPVAMTTQAQAPQTAHQQQQVAPVSTAAPFGVGLPSSVFHSVGGKSVPQNPGQNGFRLSNNGLVDVPLRRSAFPTSSYKLYAIRRSEFNYTHELTKTPTLSGVFYVV